MKIQAKQLIIGIVIGLTGLAFMSGWVSQGFQFLAAVTDVRYDAAAVIDDSTSGWAECNGWATDPNYDKEACRKKALIRACNNGFYTSGLPTPPSDKKDCPVPDTGISDAAVQGSDIAWYNWGGWDGVNANGKDFLSEGTQCGLGPTVCLPTPTPTPTNTPTPIPTNTPTPIKTPTPTVTNTPTPTVTHTPTPTKTPTPTNTPTPTQAITPTPTNSPTSTPTNTPTPTSINTPTPTATGTPSPSPTPTNSPTPTVTNTPTPTATGTPIPTNTPTSTPTPTTIPSVTPTLTATPTNTPTPTGQVLGAVDQLPETGAGFAVLGMLSGIGLALGAALNEFLKRK